MPTDIFPEIDIPVVSVIWQSQQNGGFVRRVAHTPHYDGVKKSAAERVVIEIFGAGPVDLQLVDPSKPAWRYA